MIESVESHKILMDREVTFADIRDARTARSKALEEYEKNEMARQKYEFESCRRSLAPRLYDRQLDRMKLECCKNTCAWLEIDDRFQKWFTSSTRGSAFLWLLGIPGAGQ